MLRLQYTELRAL